jgi:hypothetical protein
MFIAYSHVDEELKNELLKHLEPLKRLDLIETWHDQKIKAGDEWDKSRVFPWRNGARCM